MVELNTPQLDLVFHALGDATRRHMLRELAAGERTVASWPNLSPCRFAAASKHIKALENAGLVRREVRGRTHMCQLEPGPLASADQWLRYYERFWTGRLDALEQLLRDGRCPQGRNPQIPNPQRRQEMTQAASTQPLRRPDRSRHADARAPAARLGRPGLGLSHRKRPSPPMARRRHDGDARRRAGRAGLAQQ